MISRASTLIGPLALIAIVPFSLWSNYNGTYASWQAVRAALLLGIAVLLAIAVFNWMLKSLPKASFVVTMIVCSVLTLYLNIGVILMLAGIFAVAGLVDRAQAYRNIGLAASSIGLVLLAGAAWPALNATLESRELVSSEDALGEITLSEKPSIIHVVLDGYGAPDVLADIYDHDSERFLTQLEARGFTVLRNVTTPYSQTLPSMASIMSGGFVDVAARGSANVLRRDLGHTISHGPVATVLRDAGYTMTRNRSGYGYLDTGAWAHAGNNRIGLTELEAMLAPGGPTTFASLHNQVLKDSMQPGLLNDLAVPYFHYQHLLAPHPPFSVNADGSVRPVTTLSYLDGNHAVAMMPRGRADYIAGYRQKALFIENALLRQVDAYPPGPKIVLIHGDHGPGAFLDHESADRTCMKERMRTFMAFYSNVPDVSFDDLLRADEPLSTVNAYREIFARLSADELLRLPTVSNYLTWSKPMEAHKIPNDVMQKECNSQL
ncbi:hypothetical protein ILP92_07100 [Maribius pontilimi]|uniref:Sulfatase N-terminal domain-containing protein n=1 Tax=Palleronia pontilimi TaxID=1964209 RepID=A0A934IGK5_9RHOB|nr:hypothetical protein [Palleronia pontilimi]MBJ3762508.1 hypothetical protein [Palleronia pontilimi]